MKAESDGHGGMPAAALLLVYNCELDGQEQELEKWYQAMSGAGMGNLITSLVRIVAIKHSPGAPRGEYGMQGKMRKLHHTVVRNTPYHGVASAWVGLRVRESSLGVAEGRGGAAVGVAF